MSYGYGGVGGAYDKCKGGYPVVGGAFTSAGVILVLFILLVIISRSILC
ncbi:YjcZ family sporulation protein [Paenibacillus oenotherae]|nr:YjcZ family sporulation protein [Paenibacillus oenotherae]